MRCGLWSRSKRPIIDTHTCISSHGITLICSRTCLFSTTTKQYTSKSSKRGLKAPLKDALAGNSDPYRYVRSKEQFFDQSPSDSVQGSNSQQSNQDSSVNRPTSAQRRARGSTEAKSKASEDAGQETSHQDFGDSPRLQGNGRRDFANSKRPVHGRGHKPRLPRPYTSINVPYEKPPLSAAEQKTSSIPREEVQSHTIMRPSFLRNQIKQQRSERGGVKGEERVSNPEPEPSACVVLVSPENEVLLVHRVHNASNFPSAHVFPGGKHDDKQDGRLKKGDNKRHTDRQEYRWCAIRELFEETGILLAKKNDEFLNVTPAEREDGRKSLRANQWDFRRWIHMFDKRAEPDIQNMIPFSRWITPVNGKARRFSTQMYIYFLPLERSQSLPQTSKDSSTRLPVYDPRGNPVADNEEVIEANFETASTWLNLAANGDILLYPPQFVLLSIVKRFLDDPLPVDEDSALASQATTQSKESRPDTKAAQARRRQQLQTFIQNPPSPPPWLSPFISSSYHEPLSSWSKQYISPRNFKPSDPTSTLGKRVLLLDDPGPELQWKAGRMGDLEHVVLANWTKRGPIELEIRPRSEVVSSDEEKKLFWDAGEEGSRSLRARRMRRGLIRANWIPHKVKNSKEARREQAVKL